MFRINYEHEWTVSVPRENAWLLFSRAFENSSEVTQWPHWVSEIMNTSGQLAPLAQITATYKLGPLKAHEPYVIQQVIPQQRIVYDTGSDHPLEGQSEIELFDATEGMVKKTKIRWSGYYEPKSFSSIPTLIAFKLFFERLFFAQLEHATKNAIRIKKTRHRVVIDTAA